MNTSPTCLVKRTIALFEKIPYSLIAFLARFSIAAVFWKSGQTKVEGFAIDLISGTFQLGEPRLAASTLPLFRSEYHVPLLSPEVAAHMAAFAEHFSGVDSGRLGHTLLGPGPDWHDPDHSTLRLPRRVPDPWHLACLVATAGRQRPGQPVD